MNNEYLEKLRRSAEQGDAEAQNDLGVRYEEGNGVSQDQKQGFTQFTIQTQKMKHILDLRVFPNLLEDIKLTSHQIIDQIKPYNLVFLRTRNTFIEWQIKLPMFVPAFYDYVISKEKIPEQKNFYSYYLEINKPFFDTVNFSVELYEGLKARAYRAYPSLVRDICFNKYVSEHLIDCDVIYNIDLDIKEGIDLLICKASTFYAVSLYTNTLRGKVGRKKKENRHTPFSNVKYIEFPVEFSGSLKCGDFFLYGEQEFKSLLNEII